ncbi:CueP family metal-binding protein [Glutamicibacter sp. BW80]|uniref:CueP family metal-binding protein n=1 Tax=Glutamicibacter sp. BW80 TaxID=2024404 RepID=UPI001C3EDD13|nr:CueP family metal-binding protein [Glutamicibacter sp. BW80]
MPKKFEGSKGRRAGIVAAAAGSVLALAALTGCSTAPAPVAQPEPTVVAAEDTGEFLAELGLAGLDARAAIDRLDRMPVAQRPSDFTASVQPAQLVLTDASGRTADLPMPQDEYYLSAAPYVSQTHSCHFHSLTTCLGELAGKEVQVKATDADTGEVLVEKGVKTFDNGFLGLWVPRGINLDLEFSYEGKTAKTTVSTAGSTNATCLTELPLV